MWVRGVEMARAASGLRPALLIALQGPRIYTQYMNPERLQPDDRAATYRNAAKQDAPSHWIAKLGAASDQVGAELRPRHDDRCSLPRRRL
jgi:hypothetical protein